MARFYQHQRKHFNILMDGSKPIGGQWSFDSYNRHPLKKDLIPPSNITFKKNKYIEYVKKKLNIE